MRVKIKSKKYGIPEFQFGKKYYVAYAGVTYGEEFTFTRKNVLEFSSYDYLTDNKKKRTFSHRTSKKKFKELIKINCFHFISETDD